MSDNAYFAIIPETPVEIRELASYMGPERKRKGELFLSPVNHRDRKGNRSGIFCNTLPHPWQTGTRICLLHLRLLWNLRLSLAQLPFYVKRYLSCYIDPYSARSQMNQYEHLPVATQITIDSYPIVELYTFYHAVRQVAVSDPGRAGGTPLLVCKVMFNAKCGYENHEQLLIRGWTRAHSLSLSDSGL